MDIKLGVMKLKVLTINFITNFQPMKTNDESKICLEKKEIQIVLRNKEVCGQKIYLFTNHFTGNIMMLLNWLNSDNTVSRLHYS